MDKKSSKGISKGELTTTLSDIDLQINSLHNRSTSDFMQLNDHLKDYHKKTKIISENAFRIFETISGGKDMDLIRELENIQNRIDDYRKNIDDDNSNRLKIFKETGLHANQLNITIRNLRQDFTTLKFLTTNYSLISSYKDPATNDQGIKMWMSQISDIHHLLISLNDQVEHFRELNSSVIVRLETGIERSLGIFQNLSDETLRNINSVTRKNSESKLHFPVLKEKSLDSSKCISDIITHLQYHDIIRQKIEHIQKSHSKIIEDLSQGEKNENCSPGDYEKIGDIIDLQSAQLLLVSKEYQNALNVITRNFQVIAKDMTIISDISDRFSLENSSSQITLLRQIKDQLDNGIVQLDQADALEIDLLTRQTLEKLHLISVRIENEIKPKLASFLQFNLDCSEPESSMASSNVISQMIQLNREIQIKNREIGDNLAFLKSLTRLLDGNDKGSIWGNFEIDRLQLMVRITRILDSLDHDNEELDKVLNENRELNDNILLKIESAINKNDYCEYFENIVGHVIGQLASVNERIKPSSSAMKKAVNLEGLKTGYTMESERLIHDMVVSGNEEPSTDNSDSEIEFF